MAQDLSVISGGDFFYGLAIFLILIAIGAVIGFGIGFFINKWVKKRLGKWVSKEAPYMRSYIEKSLKVLTIVIPVVVILFFFSIASNFLELSVINSFVNTSFVVLIEIIIALFILFLGIIVARTVGSKVLSLNSEYSSIISFLTEIVIIYATVLSILEYFNIQATPFFEIFRVMLYTFGAIIALVIGIPIALSIKKSVEENSHNGKKKEK